MKDLKEIQKRYEEEMMCAERENKLCSAYEPHGITFYVSHIMQNGMFSVIVVNGDKKTIYIDLDKASKVLKEIPPTKHPRMTTFNNEYFITIFEMGVALSFAHGDMEISMNFRNEDLLDVLSKDDDGFIFENEKVNNIVEYIKTK